MIVIRWESVYAGSTPAVGAMNYIEQRTEWLRKHPKATIEEAWTAGYLQSTDNWCRKEQ